MPTSYEYYNAVMFAIAKIAEGQTPTKACALANIDWPTFRRYTTQDPELAAMLDEADQRGADAMADALLGIFDPDSTYYEPDEKKAKLISDNIKWLLSRRHNRTYGEKVEVKVEATISHVITEQLNAARERSQRAVAEQRSDVIEADYVMLPPPPAPVH